MGGGAAIALRTVFGVLGCVMVATLIYTISTSGLPFHRDLLTRWMAATLLDFYIHVAAIGAWVFYKESSWIMAVVWIVLLVCFGSITTCGYIVLQFFKLSPEESLEDPLYFVLARRWRKDGTVQKKRHSVVGARIIFTALGFLMLATLVYVGITDDSSLSDILTTPWMVATLIDFYINVVALSVWVAYKESSWIRALVWIILLACFGSTATCAYIVWQLSHLSSQDPLYLVLFNSSNSALLFLLVEASGKSDLYFVLKVNRQNILTPSKNYDGDPTWTHQVSIAKAGDGLKTLTAHEVMSYISLS